MNELETDWKDYGPPADRRFTRRSGQDIHVIDWGGTGPNVVLVHGGICSAAHWVPVVTRLKETEPDLRLIAYDLRGHGESGKPARGYGIPEMTEDLQAVFDALKLDKAVLAVQCGPWPVIIEFLQRNPGRVQGMLHIDPIIHRSSYPPDVNARSPGEYSPLHQLCGPFKDTEAVLEALCAASQEPERSRHDEEYLNYNILCDYRRTAEGAWRAKWELRKVMEMASQCMLGARTMLPALMNAPVPTKILLATDILWGPSAEDTATLLRGLGPAVVKICEGPHNLVNYRPEIVTHELLVFLEQELTPQGATI